MSRLLEGKVAAVTGAGRGIGRACALELAAHGARVVVNDLGLERDGSGTDRAVADDTVAAIRQGGGEAVANYDSVATMAGGENIVQTALSSFGRLDILVNNAGLVRDRMIFKMSEDEWDQVVGVSLKGQFCCSKPACVHFRETGHGGRIIAMSSPAAWGNVGQSNYAAAKAGIIGFIRSVALEMSKYGVTANAIWPHADTRMTVSDDVIARRARGELPPIVFPRDPEYAASVVAFLATDAAQGITGQCFDVHGGLITYIEPEKESRSIYKDGKWDLEELIKVFPITLGKVMKAPGLV